MTYKTGSSDADIASNSIVIGGETPASGVSLDLQSTTDAMSLNKVTSAQAEIISPSDPGVDPEVDVPAQIGGQRVWLRADEFDGVLTNGQTINATGWADKSGNGNDGYVDTATHVNAAPVYNTGVENGESGIHFNTTIAQKDHVRIPKAVFAGLTSAEVWCVIKNDASSPVGSQDGIWTWNSAVTESRHPRKSNAHYVEDFGTTVSKESSLTLLNPNFVHVHGVSSAPSAFNIWLGDFNVYSTGTNTVGFSDADPFIGLSQLVTFAGYFLELIVFNRTLTTSERSQLNTYAVDRYAIA